MIDYWLCRHKNLYFQNVFREILPWQKFRECKKKKTMTSKHDIVNQPDIGWSDVFKQP